MKEKSFKAMSGYIMLLILFAIIGVLIYSIIQEQPILSILAGVLIVFILPGFLMIHPNGSRVLTFFGTYSGSIKENGFYWILPFYLKKVISLKARNFESERVKVNDKRGNPILISVITVWRVKDTYKAAFEVDDYERFVKLQSDAAVRNLAGQYPYDNFEDHEEISLRSGMDEINHALELALSERLEIAGIEVMEARIGYLAYAEEIAGAMLKRQQAEAIVAARHKIVEGAVSMVQMALDRLKEEDIMEFDEDKKASMVSNLMVILCIDREATPVVNTGTLYS